MCSNKKRTAGLGLQNLLFLLLVEVNNLNGEHFILKNKNDGIKNSSLPGVNFGQLEFICVTQNAKMENVQLWTWHTKKLHCCFLLCLPSILFSLCPYLLWNIFCSYKSVAICPQLLIDILGSAQFVMWQLVCCMGTSISCTLSIVKYILPKVCKSKTTNIISRGRLSLWGSLRTRGYDKTNVLESELSSFLSIAVLELTRKDKTLTIKQKLQTKLKGALSYIN